MYKQYIMTETEVKKARNRLSEMRKIALMSRDAGDRGDYGRINVHTSNSESSVVCRGNEKDSGVKSAIFFA